MILDYSYSEQSAIGLERKTISAFEKISYVKLTPSTLLDTTIDRESDMTFTYRVQVEKDGYKTRYSPEKSFEYKSTMLNPPGNLQIRSIELVGVELRWEDRSRREESYVVEKDDGSGYQEIQRLTANSTSYRDIINGVPARALQLSYRVKAYNTIKSSTWLEGRTTYSGLGNPTNLQITDTTSYNFTIEWDDNSNVETGYSIERNNDGGLFEEITVVAPNFTEYVDFITDIGLYGYRVRAQKDNLYSSYSNEVLYNITNTLPSIPTDGLESYHPFNGNPNDETGNGNNGTVRGAILSEDRFGAMASAYSFDGLNDYIEVGRVNTVNLHSVSVWIKPNSSAEGIVVGHVAGPSEACGFGWLLFVSSANACYDVDPAGCGTANIICNNGSYNGTWTHIIGTFDGNTERLFINGALMQEASGVSFSPSSWMSIGALTFFNGYQEFFSGNIDDIRVYNRALSPEEILALYHENGWPK